MITEEEFRIQEPESRIDFVGQDGQSRFKAPILIVDHKNSFRDRYPLLQAWGILTPSL